MNKYYGNADIDFGNHKLWLLVQWKKKKTNQNQNKIYFIK